MKKFVLICIAVLTFSASCEVWMGEDYESGIIDPASIVDSDGDSNNWQINSTSAYGGLYCAESVSSGLTPDNWMISPQTFDVERYDMTNFPHLKFSVGSTDQVNFAEHYQVLISFTDNSQESFLPVFEETLTSSDWKEIDIDLGPFFGEDQWSANIYVAIRHFDSADISSLLIDDVYLYSVPYFWFDEYGDYTLVHEGVVSPYSDLDMRIYTYDRSEYDQDWNMIGMNVELHYILTDDEGTHAELSIPMALHENQVDYEGTFECNLPGQKLGTTAEYWFEATDNSELGIIGESVHFNVEWGEVTFAEGFDENVVPEGWNRFHTGTTLNGWAYDWETWLTANVYSGANSITSASQNNTGPCETENYLVTPRLRVDGDAKLKYYVNAETPEGQSESYIIFINNVGGDSASVVDYSDTLFAETIVAGTDDNEWHERIIDLKPWTGQFLWIAIKHLYTPYNYDLKLNRYLNIDEFSVAERPKLEVLDPGNAALPGEDVSITAIASDYSGINNLTIYYTVQGEAENSVLMTDNFDGSYTGAIPGQSENARCSWYIVATDDTPDMNKTISKPCDIIWFESEVLEWGSPSTVYNDAPDFINGGDKVAMDWYFGTKNYIYLNKIEIGWEYTANNITWELVEFDDIPTENVIGDLQGIHNFAAGGDTLHIEDGKNTPISGHVALVFQTPVYNEIMLDENGDKSHAWQWNSVTKWTTNLWGAFYIRMYVSQIPNGIENEFVSSTTELCQNYPNPFNPETSISFYNRIAGDVELSVYNVKGEKVASLVNEKINEGFRKVNFNASGLNSGVYYYTLKTPEKTLTKKMVLIK
ncbi:MAG: choice-of-anchor J domain-containing protein [Candidatus Delongbacteria bacterium]|nr:choice-of-anchor J domain-containing protein [Candidatus Delongbacteria bacterium]